VRLSLRRCARDESTLLRRSRSTTDDEIGDGMIYVPAGPFLVGGEPDQFGEDAPRPGRPSPASSVSRPTP